MGRKNKLQKFSDMETFGCVLQYPRHILIEKGFPYKGKWNNDYFAHPNPITLELGCGKGEYTVGLAEANPDRNYIGVDIKGARMWKGAKYVEEKGIGNAAFLRTEIELISQFFDGIKEGEPQLKSRYKNLLEILKQKGNIEKEETENDIDTCHYGV